MIDVRTFIRDELEYDVVKENKDGVLDYLNSLTEKDIDNIEERVKNDDELYDKINELINYHLYHYRKWGKDYE